MNFRADERWYDDGVLSGYGNQDVASEMAQANSWGGRATAKAVLPHRPEICAGLQQTDW